MTTIEEGKQLRGEIGKMRPDKRRRYSEDLRRRILAWLARCNAAGTPDYECSKVIGVKVHRFTLWRRLEARIAKEAERDSLELVSIESPLLRGSSIELITPAGYRIVGLAFGQLAALLREVA